MENLGKTKNFGTADKVKVWSVALLCLIIFYASIPLATCVETGYSLILIMLLVPSIVSALLIAYKRYATAITALCLLFLFSVILDASILKTVAKSKDQSAFASALSEWGDDKSKENLMKVKDFRENGLGMASSAYFTFSVQSKDMESAVEAVNYGVHHHSGHDLYGFASVVNRSINDGEFEKTMISGAAYNIIQDSLSSNAYLRLAGQLAPNASHMFESLKIHSRLSNKMFFCLSRSL